MKAVVLMLAVAGLALTAQARPYGAAGCGLGSMVMGADGNQILAATTNGTSYSQFSGITTGTSNCVDDGVAMAEREAEAFAEANFETLLQQASQGQGESLEAFAAVLGCQSASQAFGAQMQLEYSDLSAQATPVSLVDKSAAIAQRVCVN